MARIETSIEIKSPIDQVFANWTDVKSWPRYVSGLVEVEQTSAGPMVAGTTFKLITRNMGQQWAWTGKITEHDHNKKCVDILKHGSSSIYEHAAFESTEGGTKINLLYEVRAGGFFKLLTPLWVSLLRKQTMETIKRLKIILESGS